MSTSAAAALPVIGTTASPSIASEAESPFCKPDEILARARFVIETLRTRYVCEGFQIDEEGAARALTYLEGLAAGVPESDDDDFLEDVVKFFSDHGQSIDWVICGDPAVMICREASFSRRAHEMNPEVPVCKWGRVGLPESA